MIANYFIIIATAKLHYYKKIFKKKPSKMGGLCGERCEKGRGGRKVERKCPQHGPMETRRVAVQRSDN